MSSTEPNTQLATAIAPGAGGIDELLRDMRSTEDLPKTVEGMRLFLRIEAALVAAAENRALGQSQITNVIAMKAYVDFGMFVSQGHSTLPDHLKDNPADCTAIAMRADRWGLDFYGVAEKTFQIKGKLGYEAQLIGAILQKMGAIKEPALKDVYFGDWAKILGKFTQKESAKKKDEHDNALKYFVSAWNPKDEEGLGIIVSGTLPGESAPRELELLMTQATVRNSTLWATNPKQQIFYLAEKLWARKYAPQAILGVKTRDDFFEGEDPKDMGAADVLPPSKLPPEVVAEWLAESNKGTAASRKFWMSLTEAQRRDASSDMKVSMWNAAVEADKARTVDNATEQKTGSAQADPTKPSAAPPAPAASPDAPSQTVKAAADPDTGEVKDDFVEQMNAAEKKAGKKA